jgi:hypothetical protein
MTNEEKNIAAAQENLENFKNDFENLKEKYPEIELEIHEDTPRTASAMMELPGRWDSVWVVPAEIACDLESELNDAISELDEARKELENVKLQLGLWKDGNIICEETLGEIRLLKEQINGAFRERNAAHKIAERAIDDLAWFNYSNAQRLRAELNQLKEGAK